jgi:hypothetical protein
MSQGFAQGDVSPTRSRGAWPVAITGAAVVAWWVYPLFRPTGAYGGGHYGYVHIELGVVAALVWLASLAVAVCPLSMRRPLAMRLTAALGALLITVAFCDVAGVIWSVKFGHFWCDRLSYSYRDNVPDPELIARHRPGLAWNGRKAPGCEVVSFRTDERGFRNPPGIQQADLVFLGDSVTEAGEVAEEATFVRKAAGALGLSAVNLGVYTYGPQQELAVLQRFGLGYRPRAVVWQVTEWNDLDDAERYPHLEALRHPRLPWRFLYENHSPVVKLIAAILPPRHKHFVDFALSDGKIEQRAMAPYENFAPRRLHGLEEMRRSIATARALCRERGVAFVVLLVPCQIRVLAPYLRPRTATERDIYLPPGGVDRPDDLGHALLDLCRTIDCPLIDLTEPLRRRAASDNRFVYIKNDTHLGADGHDEAAHALAQVLCSSEVLALKDAESRLRSEPRPGLQQSGPPAEPHLSRAGRPGDRSVR